MCDLGINASLLKKEKRVKEWKERRRKGEKEKEKKDKQSAKDKKTIKIFLVKVEEFGFGIIILLNEIYTP